MLKQAAKTAISLGRRPITRLNLMSAIRRAQQPYKIEVGAGRAKRTPDWILTDVTWFTNQYMDATRTWPFPDNSASHIYADNMIEHVKMTQARSFLREAFRVLEPGGRIRLVTPDIGRFVASYVADDDNTKWHLRNGASRGYEMHHRVDILRSVFQDSGHHAGYLWDEEALHAELESAGFQCIERCEMGQSSDPLVAGLESREDNSDSPMILILEARKAS